MSRKKRKHADASAAGGVTGSDKNGGENGENDEELKEQVSKMMCTERGEAHHEDPPARERPAVSFTFGYQLIYDNILQCMAILQLFWIKALAKESRFTI